MISLISLLNEEKVTKISFDEAQSKKMFGPIYHGTSPEKRDLIDREGFKVFYSDARSGGTSHGYEISNYYGGIPAPVHHLGFGIYMTTVKAIAKRYNYNSVRGLKIYYADVPRLQTINFGIARTMMDWWLKNGYNYDTKSPEKIFGNPKTNLAAIKAERYKATIEMTNYLSSRYDAVWFKGKGMNTLLDGDQICIYNPVNIFELDVSTLFRPEKVVAKIDIVNDTYNQSGIISKGTKGTIETKDTVKNIISRYDANNLSNNPETKKIRDELIKRWEGATYVYRIGWETGGYTYNIPDTWVEQYVKK